MEMDYEAERPVGEPPVEIREPNTGDDGEVDELELSRMNDEGCPHAD